MNADPLDTILARFKAVEVPEPILLVDGDAGRVRLAVVWPNVRVTRVSAPPGPAEGGDLQEQWEALWHCIEYDERELADKCGLPLTEAREKLKALIGNRLIYPDGTLNTYLAKYLRKRVLDLYETKAPRRSKATQ